MLVNDKLEVKGTYKNYKNFNFLVIYGAGHLVPTNQPESAFVMIQNILNDSFKWKYNLYIFKSKKI